jgi:hypothetical protein
MALKAFYREDIRNALRAAHLAGGGPVSLIAEELSNPQLCDVPLSQVLEVYRRGFDTALTVIAYAFGVDAPARSWADDPSHGWLQAAAPHVQTLGEPARREEIGSHDLARSDLLELLISMVQHERQR